MPTGCSSVNSTETEIGIANSHDGRVIMHTSLAGKCLVLLIHSNIFHLGRSKDDKLVWNVRWRDELVWRRSVFSAHRDHYTVVIDE
jgi:hypothetical protein